MPLVEPQPFATLLVLEREAIQTVPAGSGPLILVLARSGHVEGVTKTIFVPAGSGYSSLILPDDLNADGDAFDPAEDFAIIVARAGGRCFTALRALGTPDNTLPTVVSASVDVNADADALVVVFDKAVYAPTLAGLSLNFTVGTPRTILSLVSGQGTSTLTFALSGDVASTDDLDLLVAETRTVQSINGPLVDTGSTPVDLIDDDLSLILGAKLWIRADLDVSPAGGTVTQWTDQIAGAVATLGGGPTHVNVNPKHVSLDNSNDFVNYPLSVAAGRVLYLFIVRRSHADQSDSAGIFDTSDGSGNTNIAYQFLRDFPSLSARIAGANPATYAEPAPAIRQWTVIWEPTQRIIRENGVEVAINATDATHVAVTQCRFGILFQVTPPTLAGDYDLFEAFIVDRPVGSEMTQPEIENVEAILADRWGL